MTARIDAGEVDSRQAWYVVGAAVVSTFTAFGVLYSFGASFASIAEDFDAGSGATATVFAITTSLSFALAPFTGRWVDRAGPTPVLVTGAVSLATGLILTTVAPSIVVAYLAYGVGVGTAVACAYVPMVATVGGWFERQRALALGVAVAGIGVGTLVASPLAAALIEATSWRTTFRIYAVTGAVLLLGAAVVARPGPAGVGAPTPRPLRELLAVRDFALLYGSSVLISLGLFVPFVFLAAYATDEGSGEVAAAALVGIIGGTSVIGRLGLGALAARVGAVRLYRATFLVMGCSHVLWLVAGSAYVVLVAYTVALGVGYGGFIALSPSVVAERFGLEGLGGVLGTLYTSAAIGALAGPPLAGVLIDTFGYDAAIAAAIATGLAAWVTLYGLGRKRGPSMIQRRLGVHGRGGGGRPRARRARHQLG